MRKMLTNALWDVIRPHVRPTGRQRCGAKPQVSDRVFLEALLYIARTGCPWRDLPAPFGSWDAVYNRFRRWVANGRLRKLFEALTDHPELGEIPRLFVDSTVLRAHAHAAGAARKKRESGPNALQRSKGSAAAAAGSAPKSASR
jgi:transposase